MVGHQVEKERRRECGKTGIEESRNGEWGNIGEHAVALPCPRTRVQLVCTPPREASVRFIREYCSPVSVVAQVRVAGVGFVV